MKNNLQKKRSTCYRILLTTLLLTVFCTTHTVSYAEEVKPKTSQSTNATNALHPLPPITALTEQVIPHAQPAVDDSLGATSPEVSAALNALPASQPVKDPLEKFNRGMFAFNDALDTYLIKPIATFYNAIMPKPLNEGVHNVFINFSNLPTIANDILQLNFFQMANDMWRFGINTTIGIGGLFDIAGRMGLDPYENDFGLTLATWGYENSSYLVIPFLGPSTIRDGIGIPVDYYVFSIYPHIKPYRARYALLGLYVVDRRAQLLQYESVMEEVMLDKYTFVRNAYMQRRAYKIEQNQHLSFADKGWSDKQDSTTDTATTTDTAATTTNTATTTTTDEDSQLVKADAENQATPAKTDEKQ